MAKCQSWRPQEHARHPVPLAPGQCRRCWSACRNRVEEGVKRCDECTELLVSSENPEVRRAMALEPDASTETLTRLSHDHVFSVALSADNALETRKRKSDPLGGSLRLLSRDIKQYRPSLGAPKGNPWSEN